MTVLKKDVSLQFPHLVILKASAGSGKTHALSKRFVQLILSNKIQNNNLRNILAITFSNNAAKEMKERILKWLKLVYLNSQEAEEISHLVSLERGELTDKAGELMDEILNNYSDFQVRTIDSFMTTVFRASAIDLGYNPEFEILMDNSPLVEYSFNLFLMNVEEGSKEGALLEEIVSKIQEQRQSEGSYLWDPSENILDQINTMHRRFSAIWKEPEIGDFDGEMYKLRERLKAIIEKTEDRIEKSGLERSKGSKYNRVSIAVREGRFSDIVGGSGDRIPVTKTTKRDLLPFYEQISSLWKETCGLINQYTTLYAQTYYTPYLKIYKEFIDTVEMVKRHQEKIFIGDINRELTRYLNCNIVPDVYFRIGETISHFLIDEFQDTSPIQWKNLFPLLENSLSQKGSLFVVGDAKQAIYGFRNADYTIMKDIETTNPFPSAEHIVGELNINYRSKQKILDFNEKVFKEVVTKSDKYGEAGKRSGLTDYEQEAKGENKNSGYVEVVLLERDDEDLPERQKIKELIEELQRRGYKYKDIAILTRRNDDVVKITTWLNEGGIPFISYSSLDIRRRKVAVEIVSLLNFLDSPMDDLSFASFVLGDIFRGTLKRCYPDMSGERLRGFFFTHRDSPPLYKPFQKEFTKIWEAYFEGLFRVSGYLPLYDIVTEIFSTFKVFEICSDEEGALVKILEVIKEFEGEGYNTLRDFLSFTRGSEADESEWDMNIPKETEAVNVMTFHKAKGLEFPVVVVLIYPEHHTGFNYILKEDKEGVSLLKITGDMARGNSQLENLYYEEQIRDMVDSLNTLYVGFTRARDELYILGVRKKDSFPINLLPADDYPPSVKPSIVFPGDKTIPAQFEISHCCKKIEWQLGTDRTLNIEERERGEFIHRVLSSIEFINEGFEEGLTKIIKRVKEGAGAEYDENTLADAVMGIIRHEEISGYFRYRPDRVVKREQEFSDLEGNLFRMDRVVIDKDKVIVIDYKTGMDREAEDTYISQIKGYLKIMKEIYPDRTIEGKIVYIDLKRVMGVN